VYSAGVGFGSTLDSPVAQSPSYPSNDGQAGRAPSYSPPSNDAEGRDPSYSSASGSHAAQAPIYSSLSNEPAQTSLFEAPSDLPASVGKFDFSWESEAFHNQDQRDKTEDIDFKWNIDRSRANIPSVAAVAAAADERANAATARQREEASESIFRDDTFHLRTSAQEDARFAEAKKNEEFQELLDQEFEKIKYRQAEVDAERSRINEQIMTPPEPNPAVFVTGENARIAAEERIQEYLRRADREMREAMRLQAELKQRDLDAMKREPEPEPAPVSAPEPAHVSAPESAPVSAPEPKAYENFDPYESFGGGAFAAPGDSDQDTNTKAFGFNHKGDDVVWEREREDYDPEVSILDDNRGAERATSYLEGHPDGDVAQTPVAAGNSGVPDIFVTDFANPFSVETAPEKLAAGQGAEEYSVRQEGTSEDIFDTSFANPFAIGASSAAVSKNIQGAAPQYGPADTQPYVAAPGPAAVPGQPIAPEPVVAIPGPEPTSAVTPEPIAEPGPAAAPGQPIAPEPVVATPEPEPTPAVTPEPIAEPTPAAAPEQPIAPEPVIATPEPEPTPAITPEPIPGFEPTTTPGPIAEPTPAAVPEQPITPEPAPTPAITPEPIPGFAPAITPEPIAESTPTTTPGPIAEPTPAITPGPFAAPGQPMAPAPAITPAPDAAPRRDGAFTFEPKPDQGIPQAAEPPIKPAPVASAPVHRRALDIINKPVVFPFDEAPEKPAPAKVDAAKPDADVFTVPEHKTPEAHKPAAAPDARAPAGAANTASAAAAGASATAGTAGAATVGTAAAKPASAEAAAAKDREVASKPDKQGRAKPHKGVVIVIDILIVIVIILAACFALVKLAPDTGAAELIKRGASRFLEVTGIAGEGSNAAEGVAGAGSSTDEGYVMPISDGDTLISSQLYHNYNIGTVKYDPSASWEEGAKYSITGASAAKPISDDHWSDGPQGPLLYDESAVAAIIRFDSGLVEYINQGDTAFLNSVAVGSAAEKKLAGYAASVSQLSFDSLGIGNIRKNGDDLYVWTNETVTETMGGAPVQRTTKRLYMLTPDVDTYKVSDYEDIG
jgi:hypothetical protein